MWARAGLTEQEVRTMHGVVKELATTRQARKKAADNK
jgi:tRNA C32,U32 (ribose-2'-O)-methylase TrmJ